MPLHYTKEVRKTRRKYLKVSFVKFKLLHPFTSCIEEFECIPEVWVPPCPKPKKDKISCNFCLWLQSYIFMSIFLLRKPIIVLFIYWGKPLVQVTVYITIARKRILSNPNLTTSHQLGLRENDFTTSTNTNSVSGISQLLLTKFWWNLKGRFLGAYEVISWATTFFCCSLAKLGFTILQIDKLYANPFFQILKI